MAIVRARAASIDRRIVIDDTGGLVHRKGPELAVILFGPVCCGVD